MEDYSSCPNFNAEWWEGPVIRPGDQAYVYVDYLGNNQTYFFLEDMTTNSYQPFTKDTPRPAWSDANFINERVGGYYLPNFGDAAVSGNQFGSTNYSYPLTSNNDRWYIANSSGQWLSYPTGVDNATSDFSQLWYRSS